MNRLVYGNTVFTDEDIVFGGSLVNNINEYMDLISGGLKPNICTMCLKIPAGFDPEVSRFGDEVTYYIDDGATLRGKFYVKSKRLILKNESEIYRYEFTSGIGLLAYVGHNGGMYADTDAVTAGTVIADIMGSIPYTIDADLAQTKTVGWLPRVKAARDNLRDVLFSAGGNVKMSADGSIRLGFLGSGYPKTISDYNLGVGSSYEYPEAATRVDVTAHEYHALASDERVTLYDNSQGGVAVQDWLVEFSEPCHDLEWNGSPISSSWNHGANYAVITGIGILTGQKYTHTTSVYSETTGAQNVKDVVQPISSNYLIGPHNVANVAKRAAAYYGAEKIAIETIRVTNERPGDQVTFTDSFGDTKTGFIEQMQTTISKKLNASVRILPDWVPGPFGSSYNKCRIFRASDIITATIDGQNMKILPIPVSMRGQQALVVMLSGAGGGQAGYDGEDGTAPSGQTAFDDMEPGAGGRGGQPGQPGERGRMYSFYEAALPDYYESAKVGTGGLGGSENGELGSAGTDTKLGSHSTADGIQLIDDYINLLTGIAYAKLNVPGEAGEDGGIGAGRGDAYPWLSTAGGDHVCEDGTVYQGGAADDGKYWTYRTGSSRYIRNTGGTGGGGAAHGAPGSDGRAGYDQDHEWSIGGDGATALPWPKAAETEPGRGGNGGGGGGGAAQSQFRTQDHSGYTYGFNTAGKGGKGSPGSQGGDGLIFIYYQMAS